MQPVLKPAVFIDYPLMGYTLGQLLIRYNGERRIIHGKWSTLPGVPVTHDQCVQLCREAVAKLCKAWGTEEDAVVRLMTDRRGCMSPLGYLCCLEYFAESMKSLYGGAHDVQPEV